MGYKLKCDCGEEVTRSSPTNFGKPVRCIDCKKKIAKGYYLKHKDQFIKTEKYDREKLFRIRRRLSMGLPLKESQREFLNTHKVIVDNSEA